MTTAFIWDERYNKHDLGKQKYDFENGTFMESGLAFENPERLKLTHQLLDYTNLLHEMKAFSPYFATEEAILRAHSADMLERVKKHKNIQVPTEVGEAALMSTDSYDTALLSAGGAMKAVDVLFEEPDITQSYALIRPPGHHATHNSPMGFCVFNNIAIAAEHARKYHGTNKILILDWDVHHGNGTQDIFYEDNHVFFISIHQDKNYPLYGGEIQETGDGVGEGFNLNIPLVPGCGDDEYMHILETIVEPAVASFEPDLIFISAGQDPNLYDPLSRMMVTRDGFRRMMQKMKTIAKTYCNGKLAVFQEGGYSLPYFPLATLGVFEGLLDTSVPIQTDIEKLLPFTAFHPEIDPILQEVKQTFPEIYQGGKQK